MLGNTRKKLLRWENTEIKGIKKTVNDRHRISIFEELIWVGSKKRYWNCETSVKSKPKTPFIEILALSLMECKSCHPLRATATGNNNHISRLLSASWSLNEALRGKMYYLLKEKWCYTPIWQCKATFCKRKPNQN